MRYRFECMHHIYDNTELESERWYKEHKGYYEKLTKELQKTIPYITNVVVSVSIEYNEVMIDTSEKLTDEDLKYLCDSYTLGGYRTTCTSFWDK